MSSGKLLSALDAIDPAALDYTDWVKVGMALFHEGEDISVWEDWSARDGARYSEKVCERKWKSFGRSGGVTVTAGTVYELARGRFGWKHPAPAPAVKAYKWNDTIDVSPPAGNDKTPDYDREQMLRYIETLFQPDDFVGLGTNGAFRDAKGKWCPVDSSHSLTAKQLADDIRNCRDVEMAIGTCEKAAGAWIRFNPLDGKGCSDENVTAFRYALAESDEVPVSEQKRIYEESGIPIAALVFSGGKSLHAIVKIDAHDRAEYDQRVAKLYEELDRRGLKIDPQNKNPSRFSRLPGVRRGAVPQRLLGVNLGAASWDDWAAGGKFPPIRTLSELAADPPELKDELIAGIVRRTHKMIITSDSKAGKSMMLLELCVCLATGRPWLGFACQMSHPLYIDFEVDPGSTYKRLRDVCGALGLDTAGIANLGVWNLRGYARPLDDFADDLIAAVRRTNYDVIVYDPIYKIITGDENSASDMGKFCNLFDRINAETGCTSIYSHHHSKGGGGRYRNAIDRGSGSGVFGRDPDAIIDLSELAVPENARYAAGDGYATGWRAEARLREFPNPKPFSIWFDYPLHTRDISGTLDGCPLANSPGGNLKGAPNQNRAKTIDDETDAVIEELLSIPGCVPTLGDVCNRISNPQTGRPITEKALRNRINNSAGLSEKYEIDNSKIKLR